MFINIVLKIQVFCSVFFTSVIVINVVNGSAQDSVSQIIFRSFKRGERFFFFAILIGKVKEEFLWL